MVMLNHGGADDGLYTQGMRMLVGVLSPASDYFVAFARLLVELKFLRKRLAIVTAATPFASDVGAGLERACHERRARWHGVRVRLKYRGNFARDEALARLSARAQAQPHQCRCRGGWLRTGCRPDARGGRLQS